MSWFGSNRWFVRLASVFAIALFSSVAKKASAKEERARDGAGSP